MMKSVYSVVDLDRVVKFLDGLNKLGAIHKVGLSSLEGIYLVVDGQPAPFQLDSYDGEALSLVVSV